MVGGGFIKFKGQEYMGEDVPNTGPRGVRCTNIGNIFKSMLKDVLIFGLEA